MFKNMRLGTKIVSGFAAVLVLTAAVGYVGYSGLSDVTVIVDKADSANRLIELVQAARLEQKNYMAERDEKYETLVAEKIAEATKLADKLHGQMKDQADRDGVKAARAATVDYHEVFKTWVAEEKQQAKTYEAMVTAAGEAIKQCEALHEDQDTQLAEARQSNAELVSDKLWKADSANRLIRWVSAAREAEKNFIMREDKKHVSENEAAMTQILTLCDELSSKMKLPLHQDQVTKAKTAGQAYQKAFRAWVALWDQHQVQEKTMLDSADAFLKECQDLRADQKKKLQKDMADDAVTQEKKLERIWKADSANKLFRLA